jgi:predicted nucleic acid-binding protein
MIVISDTSPISNLFLIGQLSLLPKIFGKIIIPQKVWDELLVIETDFEYDLSEFKDAEWLDICNPEDLSDVARLQVFLDAGESEAIVLAKELHADFLLIDEKDGRNVATDEGLKVIGVLGVLIRAKSAGLVPKVRPLLENLRTKAQFRIHEQLFYQVLQLVGEL